LKIGVLGLQGAVSEHLEVLRKLPVEAVWVKEDKHLAAVDALILPGGESTTISTLLEKNRLFEPLKERASNGMPIFGTCAGLVLLAKDAGRQQQQTGQKLLELMDMRVNRNAFGRQKDSMEAPITIQGIAGKFPAVFIRAPVIEKVNGTCHIIARLDQHIVAAEQEPFLATSFHPELSGDSRVHEYFIRKIKR